MDGLDMRETLRHWHKGDIYVKVIPPSRGSIEVVVFLFDVPADPRTYCASRHLVRRARRGIDAGLLQYRSDEEPGRPRHRPGGVRRGACFCFRRGRYRTCGRTRVSTSPTRWRSDCWRGRCCTAASVTLPWSAPSHRRRRGAGSRRFGRKLVHLPLKRFSGQLVERLRRLHVLNGKQVRSDAAEFIRDS